MTTLQFFAYHLSWLPVLMAPISILPQIIKNYTLRSTYGLSTFKLFLFFTAISCNTIFVQLMPFPIAYKIVLPIYWCFVTFLIIQLYWYEHRQAMKRTIIQLYGSAAIFIILLAIATHFTSYYATHTIGWIGMLSLAVHKFPQVIRNFKRKTLHGLSFYYIVIVQLIALLELTIAFILHFPIQTRLSAIRSTVFAATYLFQYLYYGTRPERQ